ncbi:MAG: hypothetical protein ACXVIS_02715 [Halobacteriota archaeon]
MFFAEITICSACKQALNVSVEHVKTVISGNEALQSRSGFLTEVQTAIRGPFVTKNPHA